MHSTHHQQSKSHVIGTPQHTGVFDVVCALFIMMSSSWPAPSGPIRRDCADLGLGRNHRRLTDVRQRQVL